MAEPSSLEPAGGTNDAPAIAAESMPPPDGADHRTCPRYGYGTVTLTRVGLARAGAACFAWIHDLCEHGIGLDVLAPLAAGVNIVVELKRGGGLKLHMHPGGARDAGWLVLPFGLPIQACTASRRARQYLATDAQPGRQPAGVSSCRPACPDKPAAAVTRCGSSGQYNRRMGCGST